MCRSCSSGKDGMGCEVGYLNIAIDGRGDWHIEHGWWRHVVGGRRRSGSVVVVIRKGEKRDKGDIKSQIIRQITTVT